MGKRSRQRAFLHIHKINVQLILEWIYSLCDFGINVANPQAVSIMRRTLCNNGGIFHSLCCRRHVYPVEIRLKQCHQTFLITTFWVHIYTWLYNMEKRMYRASYVQGVWSGFSFSQTCKVGLISVSLIMLLWNLLCENLPSNVYINSRIW